MSRRSPLLALALLLVLPPASGAATTGDRIGFRLVGAHEVEGRAVAVAGRDVRVVGRVVPYVPDRRVRVRVWRGGKLIKRVAVAPRVSRTGRTAVFRARLRGPQAGELEVFAVHEATPERPRVVARAPLSVVTPEAAPGARGRFVALLQQLLAAVGYAVPRTGVYDAGTERAVLAFRKVNGLARVATLAPEIVDRLLRGGGGFRVRHPDHGRHVEAHLGQQVLALIDQGRVVRAYHTSSGAPATPTVLGSFHFYRKDLGANALGMVDASYFFRGYAIHGYVDVPTWNASHGCLRVPIPDARAIFDWIRLGDRIDVYS